MGAPRAAGSARDEARGRDDEAPSSAETAAPTFERRPGAAAREPGGRDIAESTVQLLFAALRSGDQVTLEYVVSEVRGKPYRCVTAVVFSKT